MTASTPAPTRPRGRRGTALAAAGSAVAVATLLAAAAPATALPEDEVWLPFAERLGSEQVWDNLGLAATTQEVVTRRGGEVRLVESAPGRGLAARFPAFDGSADGPRAVLAVANADSRDWLTPGHQPFAFGARVRPDAGRDRTPYDDGDNLVQRGLAGDAAQYKIQLDGTQASCRVKGDEGVVTVVSPVELRPEEWYAVACGRDREDTADGRWVDRVRLAVAPLLPDGTRGDAVVQAELGSIGTLDFAGDTPLTVGGKLEADGTVAESSDQFNGTVDGVFLRLR